MRNRNAANLTRILLCMVFVGLLAATSCSSDGSDGFIPPPTATGSATVGVTDASALSLAQFEVTLAAIRFRTAVGTAVSVLSQPVRVDLTELADAEEIVASVGITPAPYTEVEVTVDWGSASVRIAGQSSDATLVDLNGAPLSGQQTITLSLSPGTDLELGVGEHKHLQLDFDLDHSVQVETAQNRVRMAPVLIARVNPSSSKSIRIYGEIGSIDLLSRRVSLNIRNPLTGAVTSSLVVQLSGSTSVGFNSSLNLGLAGLQLLAQSGLSPRVRVEGTLDLQNRRFNATRIRAWGGSIGPFDAVTGLVTARSGGAGADPTLTLGDADLFPFGGQPTTQQTATVNASLNDTLVLSRGSSTDTDALNVGQRLLCLGSLSGNTLDASQSPGLIVQLPTALIGTANAAPAGGTVRVNLTRIGALPVGDYDFNVSGTIVADPNDYRVDVSGLNTNGISNGTPLRIVGFGDSVSAGSTAPDFFARAILRPNATHSGLVCRWSQPGTSNPFASAGPGSLEVDISGTTTAIVNQEPFGTTNLATNPTVVPANGSGVRFGIHDASAGTTSLFDSFSDFQAALANRLSAGDRVLKISAIGDWDGGTTTLTAQGTFVIVN